MDWEKSESEADAIPMYSRFTLTSLTPLSLCIVFVTACVVRCTAYSVLAHEAIVDATWKDAIEPMLVRRFPCASADQLLEAHAYVYGGAIIQDLGYYPFGNKFFSDLTHYVRSGDFVLALIQESDNLNEYAFALGALSHYAADSSGHLMATNRAVAIMYPQLAKRYGTIVTYEDKPSAHMRVEFGFDVDQVAKGRYAPHAYHEFIGFKVSKPVLERAFKRTYSLDLSTVFSRVDLALESYRHAVSSVIPKMTKVAWHLKKNEIEHADPSETKDKFLYHIASSEYRKDWGDVYEKPGFLARVQAFFFRMTPKVGPLSSLAFQSPTPATEHLYMASFNDAVARFRELLRNRQEGRLELLNRNLDTGSTTVPASYKLSDKTYANLVDKTSGKPMSRSLQEDIAWYYEDLDKPFATKRNPKAWRKLLKELDSMHLLSGNPLNSVPGALSAERLRWSS